MAWATLTFTELRKLGYNNAVYQFLVQSNIYLIIPWYFLRV